MACLITHRENTIDVVSLDPAKNSERFSLQEIPFTEELIGPSSAAWSRRPGQYGRVAYFTIDGGTALPPADGVRRPAKVLKLELPAVPEALRS